MNYRNQPMNTNMNNRGFARRRPVYPDFGCDAPIVPPSDSCGCGCDAPVTPPDSCGCGCDAPITPPSDSCGCDTPIPPPSDSCGCGCDAPVTPPDSCGCDCDTPITPPPNPCGCGCDTAITPPPNPCGCNISIPGNSQNCGCGVSGGNRPNRPPFFGVGPEPVCPPMPPELLYCSNPAATDQLNGMALAMAYVPWQSYRNLYCAAEGFHKGTIFKELNYEFLGRRCN